MGTYTGTTPAKRGMGEKIWLGVIAFVAASALVLALVAVQRAGLTSGPATGVSPAVIHPAVFVPANGGTVIVPKTVVTSNGYICHQCAP
jgi:hypothetical protein